MKIKLMMAMTMDGKIARSSEHFPDWTSKEDKQLFARISKEAGVVIMGEKTFQTFPSPLPERLNVVFSMKENPEEIQGVRWVKGEPEKVLEELEKEGYSEALLGGGAFLNGLFAQKKLIDEIIVTLEPKIFGAGLSLFDRELDMELRLKSVEKINENSVVLRYEVLK
ncbi:MAG: dihydrofolate reductase family protein [Patescibacteria group bacterium]